MGFRRVIWIVLDSVGIGEMPDAEAYGDPGSDTLGNIARQRPCICRICAGWDWRIFRPLRGLASGGRARRSLRPCALASPARTPPGTLGDGLAFTSKSRFRYSPTDFRPR